LEVDHEFLWVTDLDKERVRRTERAGRMRTARDAIPPRLQRRKRRDGLLAGGS
jgi:hypothetical protein